MRKSNKFLGVVLVFAVVLSAEAFATNTYYVSKSTGADTNTSTQAKVKATAWAHLPGMGGATSNAAAYTPVAGDTFILMGCDVWVSADLPITWDFSGSSGNPITVTVDKTWYNSSNCPVAWNRPIFDNPSHTVFTNPSTVNTFFEIANSSSRSWITIDNIEWKNLACPSGCSGLQLYTECFNSCTNTSLTNNYFHAWNVVTDGNCILMGYGASSANNTVDHNVINGADATGASPAGGTCVGLFGTWPTTASNNIVHDLANGFVGHADANGTAFITGNQIYNIQASNAGSHPNFIETVGTGIYYISNNALHDMVAPGGDTMFLGTSGETDIVWDNVMWNLHNPPEIGSAAGTAITLMEYFNNTIVPSAGSYCIQIGHTETITNIKIQNNHCISTVSGSYNGTGMDPAIVTNATTFTIDSSNLLMTPTTATAQGYTSSQTFAYSPTLISNSTVGAGVNLTATATGNLSSLQSDTTFACSLQTVTTVLQAICPARTTNSRPSSAAWDVGAYEFTSAAIVPSGQLQNGAQIRNGAIIR